MDSRFTVLQHLKDLNYGNLNDAADWLSEDLVVHTSIRRFTKAEWLDIVESFTDAFSEIEITYDHLHIEEEWVVLDIEARGLHTNTLFLDIPAVNPLAPTYKHVLLPKQRVKCRVENDQISEITIEPLLESGMFDVLKHLGARIPPIWWLKFVWKKDKHKPNKRLVDQPELQSR